MHMLELRDEMVFTIDNEHHVGGRLPPGLSNMTVPAQFDNRISFLVSAIVRYEETIHMIHDTP